MIYIHLTPGSQREIVKYFKRLSNIFSNTHIEVLSDGLAIYRGGLCFPLLVELNEKLNFYIDEDNGDYGLVGHR